MVSDVNSEDKIVQIKGDHPNLEQFPQFDEDEVEDIFHALHMYINQNRRWSTFNATRPGYQPEHDVDLETAKRAEGVLEKMIQIVGYDMALE